MEIRALYLESPRSADGMASQVVLTGSQDVAVLEFLSFIRGYHAYQTIWDPSLGDILRLEREPTNCKDRFAVAVMNGSVVVGHLPYNIAPTVSHFLKRSVNKGMVEVTGKRVNRGAGYGMEIPCKYKLYGPKGYIDKLKELINVDGTTVALAGSSSSSSSVDEHV